MRTATTGTDQPNPCSAQPGPGLAAGCQPGPAAVAAERAAAVG